MVIFWLVLGVIFIVYVIYSLEVIKYQLRQITSKNQEEKRLSSEEIEKELEEFNE
ncbi:hypothetical protein [Aquibacillus rhizosphaerae]|uniref:SigE-dependent sporulation protein n=1 Tax=Aquibacillus rhizosphaerae TaxID=3051431 RepID=A0ABT7L0X0_9BACI|nr:hypothetical protein [Aquibacillus sp. LR5S19]MDL4839429.1 hypothetical protein [Aquibacillus sp. LR5S19]